jgi:hypothetical protein
LATGAEERLGFNLYMDHLFGTYAFQPIAIKMADHARYSGSGAAAGNVVTLKAGNNVFTTVADKDGKFAFYNAKIPNGKATLRIADQPARTVTVGKIPPIRWPRPFGG